MSAVPEKPSPQSIALRMMQGEVVSGRQLRNEYRIGERSAKKLLERAEEIRTGWMLLRFPPPRFLS